MGADIKKLRNRLKSVHSTLHLTKAMGLVAGSKIRRATEGMVKSRAYAETLSNTITQLSASPDCRKSPYFSSNGADKIRLIVICGDRGLAGGYNANIFRFVKDYPKAQIIPIGKRAYERYSFPTIYSAEQFSYDDAFSLALSLCNEFNGGEFNRLGIVYTKYISMMSQVPEIKWVLPLTTENSTTQKQQSVFEPDEITVLNAVVPAYTAGVLLASVRESFACEVAARRVAMDSAGKNAQVMIDDLSLAYNRARQSAITQEITEIIAGSGE